MAITNVAVEIEEQKIDRIFSELNQCQLPGVAVGIAVGGNAVYRKGFGLANMELPVVLSPTIKLRIGSTSKHFTCLAFMLLCERGLAAVDDRIGQYIPELHPLSKSVTVRQLMGNTSGIRDIYEIFTQFNECYSTYGGPAQSVTSADLLSLYADVDDVNAPAGTTWIYNNGGWLLLSLAIERITGQSLEELMKKEIFDPIGMNDTQFLRSDTVFVQNRGSQHVKKPDGGFERIFWGVESHVGAGAILSTVDDMLRWMSHMDGPIVGSKDTWSLMRSPQRTVSGVSTGYGFGLVVDHYRGVDTLYHAGNSFGGNAQMLKVPSAGLDIVVMSNRQDVLSTVLANRIMDECLIGLEPTNSIDQTTEIPVGVFRSEESGRVLRLFEQDGKSMVSLGGIEFLLEIDEQGTLWFTNRYRRQGIQVVGDRKAPRGVRFNDFGNWDDLIAVSDTEPSDPSLICGRFKCVPAGVDAAISLGAAGEVEMRTKGRFGAVSYRLTSAADHIWQSAPTMSRVRFLGGLLSFDATYGRFTFSNWQTRKLPFIRVN